MTTISTLLSCKAIKAYYQEDLKLSSNLKVLTAITIRKLQLSFHVTDKALKGEKGDIVRIMFIDIEHHDIQPFHCDTPHIGG